MTVTPQTTHQFTKQYVLKYILTYMAKSSHPEMSDIVVYEFSTPFGGFYERNMYGFLFP